MVCLKDNKIYRESRNNINKVCYQLTYFVLLFIIGVLQKKKKRYSHNLPLKLEIIK